MNKACETSLIRKSLTDEDTQFIIEVFHQCDADSKGYLSKEDLKVAILTIFGYKPSKYEIDQIIGFGAKSNEDGLNLDRFLKVMSSKVSLEDEDQEIRQMFNIFDTECKGFLTATDVQCAFKNVVPHIKESTVHSCFSKLDRDNDGRASFRDFEFVMKYNNNAGL